MDILFINQKRQYLTYQHRFDHANSLAISQSYENRHRCKERFYSD